MQGVEEPRNSTITYDSNALETVFVIVPSFFLTYVTTVISTILEVDCFARYLLEFVTIIVPSVLTLTLWSSSLSEVLISFIILSVTISFYVSTKDYNETHKKTYSTDKAKFITNVRAVTNFLTAIAILAVDFNIFPVRFKKNNQYGFSLMDTGVGLFIYTNGIVAPEIFDKKNNFSSTMKSIIPLIILGVLRYIITKNINYNVQVLEYGVHWNFFFTLAATKLLSYLLMTLIPVKYALFNAVFILSIHEICLQLHLAEYVFSDIPRDNFIHANREGIVSCLGYVGLYFLAVSFGLILHKKPTNSANGNYSLLVKLQLNSFFLAVVSFCFYEIFNVSRRLTNIGYCFWITFLGVFMTNLFYLGERLQSYLYERNKVVNGIYVPLIFEAINFNGLTFFLLSNILTGLVNICFDTLKADKLTAFSVLLSYMFIISVTIVILYVKGIKIKL